jgi:hypothetical protein
LTDDSFMDRPEDDAPRSYGYLPGEEPEGHLYVDDLLRVDHVEHSLHSLHEMTEAERAELRASCESIRALIGKVRQRAKDAHGFGA